MRQAGPEGAQRGDLVLRNGKVVGAALYRSGGVRGMGDALVEAALASPEDAIAAMQRAASSLAQSAGSLAEGARRVGVPLAMVEETLREHITGLAATMRDWRSGTWENLFENLPAGVTDRDSAAARAFLLDEGMTAAAALGEPEPDSVTAITAPGDVPPSLPPGGADDAWFTAPPASPAEASNPESPWDPSETNAPTQETEAAAPAPEADLAAPPEAAADAPASADDWFDDAAPEEPAPAEEPAAPEAAIPPEAAAPAAEPESAPEWSATAASEPTNEATADDEFHDDGGPDDGSAAGVDLSAPGFGESALMEAETLLDGEVLSVMLEMGNSAAATAAEAVEEETAAVRTGHILLIDEDGVLASHLVLPLREAGYVVHAAKGRTAALDKLDAAAELQERPLVILDLLLSREGGGMLGGLDVAAHAAALDPAPPVVLLAETTGDDVREKAESAKIRVLLPRPLKSELKKDEAVRGAFVVELLHAVDQHRPHPEWRVGEPAAWETGEAVPPHEGWDVAEIETRAAQAEDLPEFAVADPAARREALWRETMRELSAPLSPPEILLQILRFGAEVLHRGVLFTPAGSIDLKGFGQFGVELAPDVDPDEAVRQIRFPYADHPGIQRTLEERVAIRWTPTDTPWEAHLVRGLGGRVASEVFLGPVFCQGRIAALLYGDMLPSHDPLPDTTNLEVILGQAGLALDRHVLETRIKVLEGTDPSGRRGGG